jgi:hypothetical protein
MTAASVTAYNFESTAPKDKGGAKLMPLVSADASVAPFTLHKGIGTSQCGASILFSHLAIGTHTQTSPVEEGHPGVQLGGVVLANLAASSGSKNGTFRLNGISEHGEIYTTGARTTTSLVTTSRNAVRASSGYIIGLNGVFNTPGACITLLDNDVTKRVMIAKDANDSQYWDFRSGIFCSTSIVVEISGGGATSAIIDFKQ